MNKKIAVIVSSMAVIGVLLLGMFTYYQNNVAKITGANGDLKEYGRHYLFISSDESQMGQDIYDAACRTADAEGVYLEWCGRETGSKFSDEDCIDIGIASDVDGIILYPHEDENLTDAIGQAAESGIPVVTLVRDVSESSRISYVGVSNYQRGVLYGDEIAQLLHDGVNRVILLTDAGDSEVELNLLYAQMTQTVKSEAGEGKIMSLATKMVDGTTGFDAEETIRNLLVGDDVPDILICGTPAQTECAIQALVDYNKVSQIQVIGSYTTEMTLSALKRELIPATITLDTSALGADGVKALDEYLDSGHVSDYYNISLECIRAENVYQYIYYRKSGRTGTIGNTGEGGAS